jgi:hypothetical protein
MMPTAPALPRLALSIQQPWAWLIVNGWKDVENRTWRRSFTGPVLIHAGQTLDQEASDALLLNDHPAGALEMPEGLCAAYIDAFPQIERGLRGGIVGVAEITGCVDRHESPWFVGPYGFTLRNARPLPFRACRGALGFFDPDDVPAPGPRKAKAAKVAVDRPIPPPDLFE